MSAAVRAKLEQIVAQATPKDGPMIQGLRKEAARLLEAGGLEK